MVAVATTSRVRSVSPQVVVLVSPRCVSVVR